MSSPDIQPCAPSAAIRRGDSFALVDSLDPGSVDLILTSPPYWGLRTYGLSHNDSVLEEWESEGCPRSRVPPWDWYRRHGGVLGLEPFPEWFIEHLVEFFGRARRTLKPGASLWVNLGDTYFARWASIRDSGRQGIVEGRTRRRTPSGGYLHDKQLLMIPARFAIAMQDAGWILRNDLIWAKPNPLPSANSDRLRLSHEHWFHFVMRQPKSRPAYYYSVDQSEDGGLDVIVTATARGGNGHSATFPPSLVEGRIRTTCPPGGLVLDPFCGTGEAVTAAVRLGRRGLGFEISPKTAAVARRAVRATQLPIQAAGPRLAAGVSNG